MLEFVLSSSIFSSEVFASHNRPYSSINDHLCQRELGRKYPSCAFVCKQFWRSLVCTSENDLLLLSSWLAKVEEKKVYLEQVQSFELSRSKVELKKGRSSSHHILFLFFFQQCHRLRKLKWDVIWCDLREEYKCAIDRQKELEELTILADGIGKLFDFRSKPKILTPQTFVYCRRRK